MAEMSKLILAMILTGFCIVVFINAFGNLGANYNVPLNNTNLEGYNKLSALQNQTQILRNETVKSKETSNALDVLGSFFSNSYKGMKVMGESVNIAYEIASDSIREEYVLGKNAQLLIQVLGIILTVFVAGFLIYLIAKVKP